LGWLFGAGEGEGLPAFLEIVGGGPVRVYFFELLGLETVFDILLFLGVEFVQFSEDGGEVVAIAVYYHIFSLRIYLEIDLSQGLG
jgi:hypothetical protein